MGETFDNFCFIFSVKAEGLISEPDSALTKKAIKLKQKYLKIIEEI